MCLMWADTPSTTKWRVILYRSSVYLNAKQNLSRGRRSKCFITTLHYLANYIYSCRTGMVICQSSSNMRCKRSLLPYQILASFICQTRSLTYSNVLRILINQSHLQPTTENSLMVLLSSTAWPLPTSVTSLSMQTRYLFLTWRSSWGYLKIGCCIWYIHTGQFEGIYREKRGDVKRRKVSGETNLPGNWMDFLHDPMNMQEMFAFLL